VALLVAHTVLPSSLRDVKKKKENLLYIFESFFAASKLLCIDKVEWLLIFVQVNKVNTVRLT
jgi:hypothetical protein